MELASRIVLFVSLGAAVGAMAWAQDCSPARGLSEEERRLGWIALSGQGAKPLWTGGVGSARPDAAWKFEGACLHLADPGRGGSLYSAESFADFDLEFEWRISRGGNSGLKYACVVGLIHPDYYKYLFKPVALTLGLSLVLLLALGWAILSGRGVLGGKWGRRAGWAVAGLLLLWCGLQAATLVRGYRHAKTHPPGLEYQVTDDESNEDALSLATHRSAALYDLLAPAAGPRAKPDEFHRSRVLVQGNHVEHWLDGRKVLEYTLGSPELRHAIAGSKFSGLPVMAEKQSGLLELQNHGNEVWFRNLRIRRLP